MPPAHADPATSRSFLRALGPAIIVASVVLGPGSILTASKVGAQYGYDLVWLLVLACALMAAMVALGARLGVGLEHSPCTELARRVGRPFAAAVGVTMFLVIAGFQTSNNLAVLAALEPFAEGPAGAPAGTPAGARSSALGSGTVQVLILIALNGLIVATMYRFAKLYKPIERLMMLLVGLMILAFVGNLAWARPSLGQTLAGLVPALPADARESLLPTLSDGAVHDSLWAVQALIATTFSVAGAFYQAYLVREKGWGPRQLEQGTVDSLAGITVLGGITLVIMLTSAAVLRGRVDPDSLGTAADVARQLEPMFGSGAKILFSLGIFAGAFSSFLVNAMIGGTLLADGFGLGSGMDQRWPKRFTVAALSFGMVAAVVARLCGRGIVELIVFAQALTVVGGPLLAGSILFLATRREAAGRRKLPAWMKVLGAAGCALTVLLSLRTAWRIWLLASA